MPVLKRLLLYVNGFGVKKWKLILRSFAQGRSIRVRIPPGLAGKIETFRLLPEPIRLQDSQDSARLRIEKKIKGMFINNLNIKVGKVAS